VLPVELVELDPTVSPGLAGGPFLLPGCPAIPAPEFCALGADDTSGLLDCAQAAAGSARAARITAPVNFISVFSD
jgi:hypothetical protein